MSLKVLHLPTSVGGNSWGLAQGEKLLGIQSDVLVVNNTWLAYPCDINLDLGKYSSRLCKLYKLIEEFLLIRRGYDVYHFNFGSSLLDFPDYGLDLVDLPFYPRGAKIFVTYNGCDARQKYATMSRVSYSACHREACYSGACNDINMEERKKRRINKFARYASFFFSVNPDLMYFLPNNKAFVPYTVANWDRIETNVQVLKKDKLTIVHAPTNRICKGSDYILSALDKLKRLYGDKVEICLVENIPNDKAIRLYKKADLIIDQLMLGWYGGFAVEAMKMGKPVMCFIRKEDLAFIPREMAKDCLQAIIVADAKNVFEKLCEIMENRSVLQEYSKNGLEYVNEWHNPVKIAKQVVRYYEERV